MWTGWATFPMVFVKDTLVVGASELQALIDTCLIRSAGLPWFLAEPLEALVDHLAGKQRQPCQAAIPIFPRIRFRHWQPACSSPRKGPPDRAGKREASGRHRPFPRS